MAKSQLEKPIATTTLRLDSGDGTLAERFVVRKKVTGLITGLHFMRQNSVVTDTTNGLVHFPHLKMQIKSTNREKSAKPNLFSAITPWYFQRWQQKQSLLLLFIHLNGTEQLRWPQCKKITDIARVPIFHSISTIDDRKVAVRVTHTNESPYEIGKNYTDCRILRSDSGAIQL